MLASGTAGRVNVRSGRDRCLRTVTTASAEPISHSVACGGATAPTTVPTNATRRSMMTDSTAQTVDQMSPFNLESTCRALPGTRSSREHLGQVS